MPPRSTTGRPTIDIVTASRCGIDLTVEDLRLMLARKLKRRDTSRSRRPRPQGIPWPAWTITPSGIEVFWGDEWAAYAYAPDGTPVIDYDGVAAMLVRESQSIRDRKSERNKYLREEVDEGRAPKLLIKYLEHNVLSDKVVDAANAVLRRGDLPMEYCIRGAGRGARPCFLPASIRRWAMGTSRLELDGVTPMWPPPNAGRGHLEPAA